MSVFTSLVTKVLDVPHDPGQTMTIRRLQPKHLHAAGNASLMDSIDQMKKIGPSFIKELRELDDKTIAKALNADPLLKFDRVSLIEKGVTAWSYDVPLTQEYFEDLDDDTQQWLAAEILRLAKPSLYQSPEEQETEEKNASASCTAA